MNMATLKIFSGCRYIASPFISLEDLSWRLLLRKFGVHLCFTNLTRAQDCIENADSLFGSLPRLEDRPLIVQVGNRRVYFGHFVVSDKGATLYFHVARCAVVHLDHMIILKDFNACDVKKFTKKEKKGLVTCA